MDFHQTIEAVIADSLRSLWPSVGAGFKPEIVLCCTIFALLIARCFTWGTRFDVSFPLTFLGLTLGLVFSEPWAYWGENIPVRSEIFTGMLVLDSFTAFFRGLLLLFGLLFIVLTQITGVPDTSDATDFFCLILGGLLGMCLMASANHALMIFLAVEMASIPSYVLAGLLKNQRKSSEAALKYSIYGAGAAGVMLYGISLLTGVLNTAHLPSMAHQLASQWPVLGGDEKTVLMLGGLMLGVGLAFKLSAVPFHFWCPDVFEGAAAEIGAFLSVASKAGAMALLVRVTLGLGLIPTSHAPGSAHPTPTAAASASVETMSTAATGLFAVNDEVTHATEQSGSAPSSDASHGGDATSPSNSPGDLNGQLVGVRGFAIGVISLLSIVTCTFGNLAAYGQTNIKRLLAYSTIAHAGYMMMSVPAALTLADKDPAAAQYAISALGVYMATYVFMNLGAFAVVALLRNSLGSEEISDYAGLIRCAPFTVICFSLILFSLVGLPPLAGFMGKFLIFGALTDGWRLTGSNMMLLLIVVGGLNTAISLYYYLRVVKVMTMDRETDATRPRPQSVMTPLGASYLFAMTVPIIAIIVVFAPLHRWTLAAAAQLF